MGLVLEEELGRGLVLRLLGFRKGFLCAYVFFFFNFNLSFFFNIMLMWKIVKASKASVLYIYI